MVKKKSNNPWLTHMAKVRKENPKADFKKIAKLARASYKKK
jgi:hypothetical protein